MVKMERKSYVPVTQVYYNTPKLVLNGRTGISGLWCALHPATVVCGVLTLTGRAAKIVGAAGLVIPGQWQSNRELWVRQRWWVDCAAANSQYSGGLAWRPRVKHLFKYAVNNCWCATPTTPQLVTVTSPFSTKSRKDIKHVMQRIIYP